MSEILATVVVAERIPEGEPLLRIGGVVSTGRRAVLGAGAVVAVVGVDWLAVAGGASDDSSCVEFVTNSCSFARVFGPTMPMASMPYAS